MNPFEGIDNPEPVKGSTALYDLFIKYPEACRKTMSHEDPSLSCKCLLVKEVLAMCPDCIEKKYIIN